MSEIQLIADSGATKTDWALVEREAGAPAVLSTCTTQGLNPLYVTADEICRTVSEALTALGVRGDAEAASARFLPAVSACGAGAGLPSGVQFYGSGCAGDRIAAMTAALRRVFPPPVRLEVYSDVLGACRAVGTTGITCILGTGAVAARYDAPADAVRTASSLGYILGDEGSGAWLGRHLLADYLKEQVPPTVRSLFEDEFGPITPVQAIEHVYRLPFPNRYLASFAVFVGRHLDSDYCHALALRGLELFYRRNIARLHPAEADTVSFVGSVAHGLRSVLAEVAALHDFRLGAVVKSPLLPLAMR